MFCRSDCKSVFKVLSLSTEMQFSTDLALMNTQPQRIKVDDATRTNDNRGISWCPDSCKGKLLNLVSLTNLFEMVYRHLKYLKVSNSIYRNTLFAAVQFIIYCWVNIFSITILDPRMRYSIYQVLDLYIWL